MMCCEVVVVLWSLITERRLFEAVGAGHVACAGAMRHDPSRSRRVIIDLRPNAPPAQYVRGVLSLLGERFYRNNALVAS